MSFFLERVNYDPSNLQLDLDLYQSLTLKRLYSGQTEEDSIIEFSMLSFNSWTDCNKSYGKPLLENLLVWLSDKGYEHIHSYTQFCQLVRALAKKKEFRTLTPPTKETFCEYYPSLVCDSPLGEAKNQSIYGLVVKFDAWLNNPEKARNKPLTNKLLDWIADGSYEYINTYDLLKQLVTVLAKEKKYKTLTLPSEETFLLYCKFGWDSDMKLIRSLSSGWKV